jgi:DNA-binding NarL/FixJ family response regulator
MKEGYRILILEDDALLGSLLATWISEKVGWPVLGVYHDADAFLLECEALRPDLVLLDLALPDTDGVEVAKRVQAALPGLRIMVLSSYTDPYWVQRVLDLGLPAYLVKTSPLSPLEAAMRTVMEGGTVYDAEILKTLERLKDPDAFHKLLTARETTILTLVAQGKPDADIAEQLGISRHTVAVHRRNIRQKLGGHNDRDLIHYARTWGLVPPKLAHSAA